MFKVKSRKYKASGVPYDPPAKLLSFYPDRSPQMKIMIKVRLTEHRKRLPVNMKKSVFKPNLFWLPDVTNSEHLGDLRAPV